MLVLACMLTLIGQRFMPLSDGTRRWFVSTMLTFILSLGFWVYAKYEKPISKNDLDILKNHLDEKIDIMAQNQPKTNVSEKQGARLEIDAGPIEALKDGSYYLPISISNTGDEEINGHLGYFAQSPSLTRMSIHEENQFMKQMEDKVRVFRPEDILDTGSAISLRASLILRETKLKLTKDDIKNIYSGKVILYYGTVFAYGDETAKQKHIVYYAERCVYYNSNIRDYINCMGHNFTKNGHLPN